MLVFEGSLYSLRSIWLSPYSGPSASLAAESPVVCGAGVALWVPSNQDAWILLSFEVL